MTGNRKYLELAKFFLDQRGNAAGHELYGAYNQDHQPVIDQHEAVGHAVRAVYMYAAMADIAGIMQDASYLNAVDKIWDNVVSKKLYITGGIGARHAGESFGDNYKLPNRTAYNETCAAIGNIYWNHRMFLLHGHAKYIDVFERTLYNGMISGVSLGGDSFFYPNCLESDGKYHFNMGSLTRQPWFDCSCCPSNVIRFIPSIPDYIFAKRDRSLYVNLFMDCTANLKLDNSEIELKLNGESINLDMVDGYTVIDRKWQKGDVVDLILPMPVRRVLAHENVEDNVNKVALIRGLSNQSFS